MFKTDDSTTRLTVSFTSSCSSCSTLSSPPANSGSSMTLTSAACSRRNTAQSQGDSITTVAPLSASTAIRISRTPRRSAPM
ncbi:hypothetical protein D3C76_1499030 [compost metagenome]